MKNMIKLHLASGKNYLNDWVNIDINPKVKSDERFDLRKKIPYLDNSIDFIFNEHFIEHITFDEALVFLKECYRILKPGGVMRISTPDLNWLVELYINGKIDEFRDVKWTPKSKCKFLNEAMRKWGHQFVYDFLDLKELLNAASFYKIEVVNWRKSKYKELNMLECRPYHKEIIIEAVK